MPEGANKEYVDTAVQNVRAELFGNVPPRFEGDVGRMGKVEARVASLQEDVHATRKSLKFMEGVPGLLVKILGGLFVLKEAIDTFLPSGIFHK